MKKFWPCVPSVWVPPLELREAQEFQGLQSNQIWFNWEYWWRLSNSGVQGILVKPPARVIRRLSGCQVSLSSRHRGKEKGAKLLKNICLFLVPLVSQASCQELIKGNQREEKVYDHIYYVDKEVWGIYVKKKKRERKTCWYLCFL